MQKSDKITKFYTSGLNYYRKRLKIDEYIQRGVLQALNSLSIHVTLTANIPEAYPGESKMWLKNAHSLTSTVENQSLATDIPL